MTKKLLAILFALAAILRLAFIWRAPLWYDENFSLLLSRLPLNQMMAAAAGDTHPPLFYLLVWPLGQLLKSPHAAAAFWLLRLPSAVLSLAAMWLFWRILETFEPNPRIRISALVLMAIMPIQLYYAQEARMYALLEFLVLAAFLVMLQRRWIWFGILGILLLYTQYYGLFYWAALATVALLQNLSDRAACRKILIAAALAGLAFVPWLGILQSQMGNIKGSYWIQMTDAGAIPLALFNVLFFASSSSSVLQIPLMLAGFAWLTGALLYAFFGKPSKPLSSPRILYLLTILLMTFIPLAIAVIVSIVWQPVLIPRPLIALTPFFYWISAGPIDLLYGDFFEMIDRRRLLYAACFIVPLILICDGTIYINTANSKTFESGLDKLTYIERHWQPGDVILDTTDQYIVNILLQEPDLPHYRLTSCASELGGLSPNTRKVLGLQDMPTNLEYSRAWVLWIYSPLTQAPEQCIENLFTLQDPVLVLHSEDNEYIYSELFLVEGSQ